MFELRISCTMWFASGAIVTLESMMWVVTRIRNNNWDCHCSQTLYHPYRRVNHTAWAIFYAIMLYCVYLTAREFEINDRHRFIEIEAKVKELEKSMEEQRKLNDEMSLQKQMAASEKRAVKRMLAKYDAEEKRQLAKFKILCKDLVFPKENDGGYKKLGSGATARVVRAEYFGQGVAVKMINTSLDAEDLVEKFFDEIKLTAPLSHPNIVDCLGGIWGEDASFGTCIVMELVTRGDLSGFISRGLNVTGTMCLDVANGMQYLNSRKVQIMHRDLKPENILINAKLKAKISDFGESRHYSVATAAVDYRESNLITFKAHQYTLVGTANYIDPRIARGETYDQRCDVFSFGVMLAEAACAKRVSELAEETTIAHAVGKGNGAKHTSRMGKLKSAAALHLQGYRVDLPVQLEEELPGLCELIRRCWHEDTATRPTFTAISNELEAIVERNDGALRGIVATF